MSRTDTSLAYKIEQAAAADLKQILALQKTAYLSEAEIYNDFNIPPLLQSDDEIEKEFSSHLFLKIELEGEIIGSVRACEKDGVCHVGKLIVSPEHQNKGLGSALLRGIEAHYPSVRAYELFTGSRSLKNLHIYAKHGYMIRDSRKVSPSLTISFLRKENLNR
ncbi:GNAT family N-acetyltransferase [Maridesulfovibrio sp. FT414]|uniref:GNAT family N-acetyltransferase n=1 Tax=Maridesulfovibrio sp. FT414 TaxID=2979469 RepID=UPI003D804F49